MRQRELTVGESDVTPVDKAYAYATRSSGSDRELLVFEQEKPGAGVQVPKGTVDDGESPSGAVVRELGEECGVEDVTSVSHLTTDRWTHDRRGVYRRHFFHVHVQDDRDEWNHVVTGGGEDDGLVFSCYWTCPRSVSLSRDMGDYLEWLG